MNATSTASITGRHYLTRRGVAIEMARGRIEAVRDLGDEAACRDLPWIAPGLIDIQSNGYGGQEFSSPDLTPETGGGHRAPARGVSGVTRFCPTLTTASFEVIAHALATIAAACESIARRGRRGRRRPPRRALHLAAKTAPAEHIRWQHCRPPDWDEFRAAPGRGRGRDSDRHHVASSIAEAAAFIERVVRTRRGGGHRAHGGRLGPDPRGGRRRRPAEHPPGQRRPSRMLPRHPNYIWDQLADDRLMASLIVDGHHLPPRGRQVVRPREDARAVILVSDVSGMAGLPRGATGPSCASWRCSPTAGWWSPDRTSCWPALRGPSATGSPTSCGSLASTWRPRSWRSITRHGC